MLGSSICGSYSRVSLIYIGQLNMLAGDLLHSLGQGTNLRAILLIGHRYVQSQQVAERVNVRMNLRSLAPLGAIVAAACTRLWR